jgi:Glycosyl hydrolases family 18
MKKKAFLFSLILATTAQAMSYETYLESWDSHVLDVVNNTPGLSPAISSDTFYEMIFNVAFGNLNFNGSTPSGFQFNSFGGDLTTNLSTINNQIKNVGRGGKLKLSFGGATYPLHACSSFPSAGGDTTAFLQTLPSLIANYIVSNNLDGVDFDIEDAGSNLPQGYTPASFAAMLQQFIINVRGAFNALSAPNALITVTTPGQGWNTYWQILIQGLTQYEINNDVKIIDAWNVMEYDLWVASSLSFSQQIIADIETYTGAIGTTPGPNGSPGWGIPSEKIQLSLMIGVDDQHHGMSPQDADDLINNCISNYKLYGGMMSWDHNRDAVSPGASTPGTGYSAYSFNNALRPALANVSAKLKSEPLVPHLDTTD